MHHQVTETTMQDLIDRSIAFTHRALAAVRELGPFHYIDLNETPAGAAETSSPLACTTVTLVKKDEYDRFTDIVDKNGKRIDDLTVNEPPYRYKLSGASVYLTIPTFMLGFEAGVQDLFSLMKTPGEAGSMCSYGRRAWAQLKEGDIPTDLPDFSSKYWECTQAPGSEMTTDRIPEAMMYPAHIRAWNHGSFVPQPENTFRTDQPLWHMREANRIRYNNYDRLPQPVLDALDPVKIATLFPHLSIKASNAGMIAYTQSATAGVMDRQAVMRPGRFIRQFAKEGISDEEVKQLAAQTTAHLGSQFQHSNQREDYARAYMKGPSSCMSYGEDGKEFSRLMVDGVFVHPTEVYAHPENDLEIVWCEVGGDIVARTIINKARMQYPRIYAKESVSNAEVRLKGYLDDLGYTQHDLALTNQKLLRISPTNYPRAIICPYIDSSNLGVDVYDDHLVAGGPENANHETGCLNDYDTRRGDDWECDCCNEGFDEDETQYTDWNGDPICENCRSEYVEAYCTDHQEERWVPRDDSNLFELQGVNRGSLRYHSRICFNSGHRINFHKYDLVLLDDRYYDSSTLALADDCCQTESGEYIFTNDLEDHDLFLNEDTGTACDVDKWAVLIDAEGNTELTEISDIDEDLYEHSGNTDDTYPMLKVFEPITEEDAA